MPSSSPAAPRLSIGLPVYNGADYLESAIQSVLNQTFTDFELILCDNASTDGTQAICASAARRDARVRYLRHPHNLGAARNYNSALAAARAPLFRWISHDDVLAPSCLQACVDVLDRHPNAVGAYTQTQVIDAAGTPQPTPHWMQRPLQATAPAAATRFRNFLSTYCWEGSPGPLFGVVRTEVLRATMQHGDFPSADLILIGELALWGPMREIPEPLFMYRRHSGNSTSATNSQIGALWSWFDPQQGTGPAWLEWRWLAELYRAIGRAPLTPRERAACLLALLRHYALRHGLQYLKEIVYVATARLGLHRTTPPPRVLGLQAMYPYFWERP